MLPDPFWDVLKRSGVFSWWLVRRSAWVAGSSLVVILLPIFIQQQRLEVEEMQSMQKKQVRSSRLQFAFELGRMFK